MESFGNFLDILILFGSIQGIISASILLAKKKNTTNRLLGAILIIISLACINIYLFQVLRGEIPFVLQLLERMIPLIIIMPLGPLIYFYVKSTSGESFRFKHERIHFAPIILDLIPSVLSTVWIIMFALGLSESIEPEELSLFKDSYDKYVDIPRWFSTTIYLIAAVKFFRSRQIANKKNIWLKQFLLVFGCFQVVWLFHLIPYLIPSTSGWLLNTLSWYPIYLPLTILVYWLGINGMIQSRSSEVQAINKETLKSTLESLDKIMTNELLFLTPTLSLNDLVEKTGIDQKTISTALNQFLGKSFNEYVNTYRVEEVKRKMADSSYNYLSITGIALESGFNSQATFQRAFKAITGETPKSFRTSASKDR